MFHGWHPTAETSLVRNPHNLPPFFLSVAVLSLIISSLSEQAVSRPNSEAVALSSLLSHSFHQLTVVSNENDAIERQHYQFRCFSHDARRAVTSLPRARPTVLRWSSPPGTIADEASGPSKGTISDHLLSFRLFVITHCPRMWLVAALLLVSMDKIKPYSLDAIHTSALSILPVQAFGGIL